MLLFHEEIILRVRSREGVRVGNFEVWSFVIVISGSYTLLVIAHVNRHQRHQIGWLVSKSKGLIKKLQRLSMFVVMIVLILQQYQHNFSLLNVTNTGVC